MNANHTPTIQPEEKIPETWVDFVIYIFGGFGLFILASIGVGLLVVDTKASLLLLFLAVMLNVIFIGGSVIFLGIFRHKTTWKKIGLFPIRIKWEWLIAAPLLVVVLLFVRSGIGLIVQWLIEGNFDSLQARADLFTSNMTLSWPVFLVSLIGTGIMGPISEELYFRGLIHRFLIPRMGFIWRVLVSSLFFGLGHIDSAGVAVSSFIMGIVLAVVYEKSESLWIPIIMHILTNTFAVIALFATLLLSNYFQ